METASNQSKQSSQETSWKGNVAYQNVPRYVDLSLELEEQYLLTQTNKNHRKFLKHILLNVLALGVEEGNDP